MKLEVGMYVRTTTGNIYVIDEREISDRFNSSSYLPIEKSSFNLIDLIEVGDIVNSGEVIKVYLHDKLNEKDNCVELATHYLGIDEIKSILTHEQYEANAYTVVE